MFLELVLVIPVWFFAIWLFANLYRIYFFFQHRTATRRFESVLENLRTSAAESGNSLRDGLIAEYEKQRSMNAERETKEQQLTANKLHGIEIFGDGDKFPAAHFPIAAWTALAWFELPRSIASKDFIYPPILPSTAQNVTL